MKTNTKTQDILKFQREMAWVIKFKAGSHPETSDDFFLSDTNDQSDIDHAMGYRTKKEAEEAAYDLLYVVKIDRRKNFRKPKQ
jgi:hypothetical protein